MAVPNINADIDDDGTSSEWKLPRKLFNMRQTHHSMYLHKIADRLTDANAHYTTLLWDVRHKVAHELTVLGKKERLDELALNKLHRDTAPGLAYLESAIPLDVWHTIMDHVVEYGPMRQSCRFFRSLVNAWMGRKTWRNGQFQHHNAALAVETVLSTGINRLGPVRSVDGTLHRIKFIVGFFAGSGAFQRMFHSLEKVRTSLANSNDPWFKITLLVSDHITKLAVKFYAELYTTPQPAHRNSIDSIPACVLSQLPEAVRIHRISFIRELLDWQCRTNLILHYYMNDSNPTPAPVTLFSEHGNGLKGYAFRHPILPHSNRTLHHLLTDSYYTENLPLQEEVWLRLAYCTESSERDSPMTVPFLSHLHRHLIMGKVDVKVARRLYLVWLNRLPSPDASSSSSFEVTASGEDASPVALFPPAARHRVSNILAMLHRDCIPMLGRGQTSFTITQATSVLLFIALAIERNVGINSEYQPLDYFPTAVTSWVPENVCARLGYFFKNSFTALQGAIRTVWKNFTTENDIGERKPKTPSSLTILHETYMNLFKTLRNCLVLQTTMFNHIEWRTVAKHAILQCIHNDTFIHTHSDTVVSLIVEFIVELNCATERVVGPHEISNREFESVAAFSQLIARHEGTSVSQYEHILGFVEQLQYPAKHTADVVREKLDTYIESRSHPYTNLAENTALLRELFYLSQNKQVQIAAHHARNACQDLEVMERAREIKIPKELREAYKRRKPVPAVTKCHRRLCILIMHHCKVLEENVK